MIIAATDAAQLLRPADTDVSDLTEAQRAGDPFWRTDGSLEIPFDPEPSTEEQQQIRRRLLTDTPERETWVGDLNAAHASIADRDTAVAAAVRLLIEDRLGPLLMET